MISDSLVTGTEDPFSPTEPERGEPYLFLALQAHQPFAPTVRFSLRGVRDVRIGRSSAFKLKRDNSDRTLSIGVPDSWISARHLELKQVLGRWVGEDLGSHNGSLLNQERLESAPLNDGDLLEVGRSFFIFRQSLPAAEETGPDLSSDELTGPDGLRTLLPQLGRQFSAVRSVARSNVSVIIQGDTGTGKELVAKAIHQLSGRSGSLVAVNCAGIPPTLAENEFFGHERSAFSGASERRAGLLRAADRGTLFLDEVADLPLPSQASLLRALQEQQVRPLGALAPVAVDLRVCAATHQDLAERVAHREFREDFWARLRGFTVHLPPLRERREDLGLLLGALLRRLTSNAEDLGFHRSAARALFQYDWPQNIRELEKCIQASLVLAPDGMVRLDHLPIGVRQSGTVRTATLEGSEEARPSTQDQLLREQLVELLTKHRGNVAAVGRALGKRPTQVRRWVQRFRLPLHQYRG